MKRPSDLPARTEQILCSIVKAYLEDGQPVASSDISRLKRHSLSSASIRGVMADLTSDGYLQQSHPSAGRVPTGKAIQIFVDSLPEKRVLHAEIDRIREALGAATVDERVERCSHLLTQMTKGVAIAATIPSERQLLDQVQLLSLGDRRVLMVVVTSDKVVHDQVVLLDEPVAQDELNTVRNYINANFSGWEISDVQREIRSRVEVAAAAYDLILRRLILLYEKGLLSMGLEPEVHLEGTSNLVDFELQLTRENVKELFRALEEKRLVLALLDRFLNSSGHLDVRIGLGEDPPAMQGLSLVGINVSTPRGLSAKIAVLGPMRMDYSRAMSAVLHVGRAFSTLPC
jgi:heat-inducible transcriptional repressor